MAMVTWNQDADSFNSDNMWFPMPPNRSLYLTVPVAQGKSIRADLYIIGPIAELEPYQLVYAA